MEQSLKPTPASQWAGKIDVVGTDVPLPSGNVARVRQVSPSAFLSSGIIPDPLMSIVRKAIATKRGMRPKQVQEIADDPKLLASTLQLFDEMLAYVMVEPKVSMPPACDFGADENGNGACGEYANTEVHENPTERGHHAYSEGAREEGVLYADQVILDDKMFIFNWCVGGTRDLEKFRSEHEAVVESLSDGEDVQVPSE